MQTILGANGVIGRELSRHLPRYSNRIRQVSRSPKQVNATDELFSADLLDAEATADAVAGSEITYLVAGLKYDHKVWEEQWPRVMRNAIDACKRHGSALVFFDNVYAYGRVNGVMREDTDITNAHTNRPRGPRLASRCHSTALNWLTSKWSRRAGRPVRSCRRGARLIRDR